METISRNKMANWFSLTVALWQKVEDRPLNYSEQIFCSIRFVICEHSQTKILFVPGLAASIF